MEILMIKVLCIHSFSVLKKFAPNLYYLYKKHLQGSILEPGQWFHGSREESLQIFGKFYRFTIKQYVESFFLGSSHKLNLTDFHM